MKCLCIVFGQFGPYHHARVNSLRMAAADKGLKVLALQVADRTETYFWESLTGEVDSLQTLCPGSEESVSSIEVFFKSRKAFKDGDVDVALLPSYWPPRYFALFAAAKSLGIRTVMMNESHAETERAKGWRRWIKRQIVRRFDAALVGGEPQRRHFASLGMHKDKLFTGYDAVDNDFFAARADEVRAAAKKSRQSAVSVGLEQQACLEDSAGSGQVPSIRKAYGLPERYFLSLGRMVEKKNLAMLVAAYAKFCDEWRVTSDEFTRQAPASLVFVGSGELESALREQARSLGLRVVDRTDWRVEKTGHSRATRDGARRSREQIDPEPWKDFSHGSTRINTDGSERLAADRTKGNAASLVIAYGPSTASGPPVRAGCGLSPETTGGEDSAAMKTRDLLPATSHEENCGTVFFYGFRQIEENPVFYALAEAFVLPSLKEEWGLVVNEAMAAGLPVIVSRTAGCAEDLVPKAPASGQVTIGERDVNEELRSGNKR